MTVCKQNRAVSRKFLPVNISLILPNLKVKMPILQIFYYLILVLSSSVWVVVYFSQFILCRWDRKKQRYVRMSNPCVANPSEVATFFNSRKQASASWVTDHVDKQHLSFIRNFSFCVDDVFSVLAVLYSNKENKYGSSLSILLKQNLCRRVSIQWSVSRIYVNSRDIRFMPQIRAGVTFIQTFYG